MIVSNTGAPSDAEGDLHAQAESTRVAEREILRLVEKYGRDTVLTAFSEVQDYVERLTRQETRLQNRLADIRAERPALEALYSTLSPDQRQTLARSAQMGGRGMMRGRMMQRRGLMRDGPRGGMLQRGPMGRGTPQPDAPPPPG